MRVKVRIERKDIWFKSAIFVLLIGIGFIVAYNSGGPFDVMGHEVSELENIQEKITGSCGAGKVIDKIYPNGSVRCQDISVSSGASLPASCGSNNQVAKWKTASSTWQCSSCLQFSCSA